MTAGSSYPNCLICDGATAYYFSKTYPAYPGSPFSGPLKVDYTRCGDCGFVLSDTHRRLPPDVWGQLNDTWHRHFEDPALPNLTNQPPYANQGLALAILANNGIVDPDDTLDYAAGYGTLARFLDKYFDTRVKVFDRYVRNPDPGMAYVDEGDLGRYRLVINSAMFEHVLDRAALDEVNALVADDGVLMLHTVVCERVPADPDWFYLTPMVHTAFHTNRSMAVLMAQWGYAASVYCPQAKSWFLFKNGCGVLDQLESLVGAINREVQSEYLIYRAGFVDYWKGFQSARKRPVLRGLRTVIPRRRES